MRHYNSQHEHSLHSKGTSLYTSTFHFVDQYTHTQQEANKKTDPVKASHNTNEMDRKGKKCSTTMLEEQNNIKLWIQY